MAKPTHDVRKNLLLRSAQFDRQVVFLLAAVDGEHPVARQLTDLLLELKVHFVNAAAVLLRAVHRCRTGRARAPCSASLRIRLLLGRLLCRRFLFLRCAQKPIFPGGIANPGAKIRIVGNPLCNDIQSSLQCLLRCLCRLCVVFILLPGRQSDIAGCLLQKVSVNGLRHDGIRQRLQSLFLCNAGSGFFLLLVRPVEVLDRDQRHGLLHLRCQLRCQCPLLFDGRQHLCFALLQVPQSAQALSQKAQLLIVQRSGCLLAVAGNEGNRIPLINQADRRFDLTAAYLAPVVIGHLCHFLHQLLCNIQCHRFLLSLLFRVPVGNYSPI